MNECRNDAEIIFCKMKVVYKKNFPNLTGNKILPLWIRMMKDVCGLKIQNINSIPIPVDVHVARATIFAGCIEANNVRTSIEKISPLIDEVWRKASNQSKEFSKLELDEPLWTLSKYGCSKLKNRKCPFFSNCPVKEFCVGMKKNVKVVQGEDGIIIGENLNWRFDERKRSNSDCYRI